MRCLRNSYVRREIGQYRNGIVMTRSQHREDNLQTERYLENAFSLVTKTTRSR